MSASNFELVRHMLIESEFILEHVQGKSKNEVLSDEVLCRALVRSLEIIGEAAKKIDEDFRVNTLEGNYKQGKAGDYLMRGIDGELYICDGPIFEKTYDFV